MSQEIESHTLAGQKFLESSANGVSGIIESDDYNGVQDAIDAANPGDLVFISAGEYDETVVIDKEISVFGATHSSNTEMRPDEDSNPVLRITGDHVTLMNLRIRNYGSSSPLSVEGEAAYITGCTFADATLLIDSEAESNRVIGNNFATQNMDVNGDGNIVLGNVFTGTISDNGSGNEIGFNS